MQYPSNPTVRLEDDDDDDDDDEEEVATVVGTDVDAIAAAAAALSTASDRLRRIAAVMSAGGSCFRADEAGPPLRPLGSGTVPGDGLAAAGSRAVTSLDTLVVAEARSSRGWLGETSSLPSDLRALLLPICLCWLRTVPAYVA